MDEQTKIEVATLIGESMATMVQTLQELTVRIASEAVNTYAEMRGDKLTPEQIDEMEEKLSALSADLFPKFLKAISEHRG